MRNIEACLYVSPSDRTTLGRLVADGKTAQKIVARARIVLLSGSGLGTNAIRREAGVAKPTVWRWQEAYMDGGIERLLKDKGKGARAGKKPIGDEVRLAIVTKTAKEKPANATHWSARMMAKEMGVGHTTVQRIWKEHGLKPHLTRTFKLSNDPKFAEKVVDIVGLYLDPPDKAVVLCVDEKSQIQALDRTQPGLPMKKGRAATMTHDYKRNGTTTLFAALDVLQGRVVGQCYERHRHQEFLRFLRRLEQEFPGAMRLHLVMDNYGTHKHPNVRAWLKRHPRFIAHFVPTSSSWLNLVERWFGELTSKRIRRGSFASVTDLQQAIAEFLAAWNENPKPFVWTATVQSIVEKLSRCRQTLEKIQPGCTLPRRRKAKK